MDGYYREFPLKDGRALLLRSPRPETDALPCLNFLKAVGGETDYLLCDENGVEGLTEEGEKAFLEAFNAAPDRGMYIGLVNQEMAALFDFHSLGRKRIAHNAEIGLSVRKTFWNLGIGSIAMETLIGQARQTGLIRNLTLSVRFDNARAVSLYQRFGFIKTGTHPGRICVAGKYYDEMTMDLEL